jgi:hypothetical protein
VPYVNPAIGFQFVNTIAYNVTEYVRKKFKKNYFISNANFSDRININGLVSLNMKSPSTMVFNTVQQ